MEIRNLFRDDGAVSEVIGVILMVAITVIIAAVIASFVLGIGGQQQTTPAASFTFSYEAGGAADGTNADGVVTITHDGGDSIKWNELYVRGNFGSGGAEASADSWKGYYNTAPSNPVPAATVSGDESRVVAGDRLELLVDSDYDLSVNFEAQEGDASSTLAEDEGPDA